MTDRYAPSATEQAAMHKALLRSVDIVGAVTPAETARLRELEAWLKELEKELEAARAVLAEAKQ